MTITKINTNVRQSRRTRRTFSPEYKQNVLKTISELIETAPDKIGLFLKKQGLTWTMVQAWKDQVDAPTVSPEAVPEIEEKPPSNGVAQMQVGRVRKYKNVTMDTLYQENILLKERLAEMEGSKKKVKLIIEMQNRMLDVLDVSK